MPPGPDWQAATASGGSNCVEAGTTGDGQIMVRDSKNPAGPTLTFTRAEFAAFVAGCKDGEFDQLAGIDHGDQA